MEMVKDISMQPEGSDARHYTELNEDVLFARGSRKHGAVLPDTRRLSARKIRPSDAAAPTSMIPPAASSLRNSFMAVTGMS